MFGFRAFFATIILIVITSAAAWMTHVVTCLMLGKWGS